MPDFIYPRDFFRGREEEEQRGLCFVLMPFAGEYRPLYDGVVKPTVEECGMECLRADDIYSPRPILVTVMEQIGKAQLVIADLSGRNPNVFYEVGMAHTVKSNDQVMLISRSMEDVPFDLRHLRLIVYDDSPQGLEKLKIDLQNALQSLGLAEAVEEAVSVAIEGEGESGPTEAKLVLGTEWEWSAAVVSFCGSDGEDRGALGGRISAGLLEWFDFDDIGKEAFEIRFPGGRFKMLSPSAPSLQIGADQQVSLDELVAMVWLRYDGVKYGIDVPFTAGPFVRELKALDQPITYVSDSKIVVPVDERRDVGFIDLSSGGRDAPERMWLKLRAPEGRSYTASEGVVAFDEIIAFLTCKVPAKQLADNLSNLLFLR